MLVSEPSCSDGAEQQSSGLNRRGFRLRLRRPVGCVVMPGGLILLAQLAGRLSRVCLVANLSICAVAVGNLEALAQAAGAFGEERRLTRSIPSSELLRQTDNSATQRLRLDVGDRVLLRARQRCIRTSRASGSRPTSRMVECREAGCRYCRACRRRGLGEKQPTHCFTKGGSCL